MLGRGGDAARSDAVVAPQHHGKMAPLQAFLHLAVQAPVHIHHLLIGPQVGQALTLGQGNDISPVKHGIAQLLQPLQKAAVADGHGSHGHAALGGAQIHLDADDVQLPFHNRSPLCRYSWFLPEA